jgi:putative toxin-antitoxin system antitoxin component (TIGR02293 family)
MATSLTKHAAARHARGRGIDYARAFELGSIEKVALARAGIDPSVVHEIALDMGIQVGRVSQMLRLPTSTMARKQQAAKPLNVDQSERVLRLQSLIGLAEKIVAQYGNPKGFDAAKWVGQWVERPVPALGGATPSSFLDTAEGAKLVESTLMGMVSGGYA